MKRFVPFLALLAASTALAQVTVLDPWVRGTVPQQKATGAFMQLKAEQDSRLVAARSPVAGVVEIHEMAMEKDVMKMRALPTGLELPAGKTVELKPGGYHVMLMELKGQVKEGGAVPVTLIFEGKDRKRTEVDIQAAVRPLGEARAMPGHHRH